MKASKEKLKVSFYLKKNVLRGGLCPIMGRITIGQDKVQFSCKLEANPDLWDTRAGRVNGKSAHARKVNAEIDKINVSLNTRYREIVSLRGQAKTSLEILPLVFARHVIRGYTRHCAKPLVVGSVFVYLFSD